MKNPLTNFLRPIQAGLIALALPAAAQIPNTLLHSIPAPSVGVQSGAQLGYSLAMDGAYTVVGAPLDDIGGTDSGMVKVFDSTTGGLLFVLPNPGPSMGDYFGTSVAISGTRVVVGARYDDTGASNAGSAYVYDLTSSTPTVPVATLNNPNPAVLDLFGSSVAISGTRVVVGTPLDDTGESTAGSAYVYDLSSGTPTVPVATLNNPGPAANDNFGTSVAISGTLVVVGAVADDTGASNAGSAYVYDLASGTPTVPVATLNNPGPEASDSFGFSVAISGTRVVVGAREDGTVDAGSAYVYDLSSGTPTVPVATLNNPSPGFQDLFGTSVAISGTLVVVGTPLDDTGASNAGSAYVYDLSSGTPTVPIATLNKPGPGLGDNFGSSVAISGTWVVVGTPLDDTGATDAGSAYVYDLSSGTPTVPVAILNNPSPAVGDQFGNSVAISGTRVVVGTQFDDMGAADAGSGYVYDLTSSTPTEPVAILNNPGPAASDTFGQSVVLDGTIVAIGTPYDGSGVTGKGAAYIFGPHPLDQDSDTLRDAWELTHWPSTTGHRPLDDDDHDGLVNLLEMAFGLNPTLPSAGGLPAVANEGGFMTMTITKQPGAAYEVQSAGTLLPALPDSFSASSTTVLLNDATTLKVRDNTLFGTPPARFMRVQVTGAP
jgi:hypothetical protein